MATNRTFGDLAGIEPGAVFNSRRELAAAGVHRATQAGIVGNGADGAESIVVSGGYEDDEDYGDVIIYTGHGGNDSATRRQVADQSLDAPGNAALVTSSLTGTPVRVIRGPSRESSFAPKSGYRYDGLFRVESWWTEAGRSGYRVCRYRLLLITDRGQVSPGVTNQLTATVPIGSPSTRRVQTTVQRVVRSGAVAEYVKRLHDHTCQFCGLRLEVRGRGYSEAAHIRPLGRPHDGPDQPDNVLCLCPNCHVLFDHGEITISDALIVTTSTGRADLRTARNHVVHPKHLRYHRDHHHE